MKLKHRNSRRNVLPIQPNHPYQVSVFWRRVNGIYGADHKETDKKNPDLEEAVNGYRQMAAAQRAKASGR